jgi:adhesin HecA-like repeat protein
MTRISDGGRALALTTGLLMAARCSARIADLTLVSTKNIDLSPAQLDVRRGVRATGQDCVYAPLGLIPLGVPNLETAVDRALEKGGGNVMVDQVTYQRGIYFVVASQMCIIAEGTVLNTATTAAAVPR